MNRTLKGLGRNKPERNGRKARRMWCYVYMRHGWHNFNWPGHMMWSATHKAEV